MAGRDHAMMSESEPGARRRVADSLRCTPPRLPIKHPLADGNGDPYRDRFVNCCSFATTSIGPIRSVRRSTPPTVGVDHARSALDRQFTHHQPAPQRNRHGRAAIDVARRDVLLQLNQLIVLLSAFSGMGMESMTRGPSWRFLDIGRRLERAQHTVRLLHGRARAATAEPAPVIEALHQNRRQLDDLSLAIPDFDSTQRRPSTCFSPTKPTRVRPRFNWRRWPSMWKACRTTTNGRSRRPSNACMLAAQNGIAAHRRRSLVHASESDGGVHRQLGELLAAWSGT